MPALAKLRGAPQYGDSCSVSKGRPLPAVPYVLFWLLGIIWGSAFIYMKLAAALISPLQIVLLRVLFALLPLLLYAQAKGAFDRRHLKHGGHFLVMAVVGTIGYYYGFAKGTSLLLSGVAGALSGLTPILSFLLALLFLREERATGLKALGIALGFLGVLLIARPFGADLGATNIEGVIYTVIGSFSVGASFVYAKKYVLPLKIPVSALLTYQLGLSLAILLLVTDLQGIGNILADPYAAAGLVLGLGAVGTGLAFILYYHIIEALGAVAAASVAYIPPVVALAIGVFLAGEAVDFWEYAGAALILAGVVLVNRQAQNSKPAIR